MRLVMIVLHYPSPVLADSPVLGKQSILATTSLARSAATVSLANEPKPKARRRPPPEYASVVSNIQTCVLYGQGRSHPSQRKGNPEELRHVAYSWAIEVSGFITWAQFQRTSSLLRHRHGRPIKDLHKVSVLVDGYTDVPIVEVTSSNRPLPNAADVLCPVPQETSLPVPTETTRRDTPSASRVIRCAT
ncbi:hypothetical protein K466DRAFT_668567 [Polyporus arcularius HHB13444]|uniref:Uncharacterized protein n=1 Tax=Polyporus arcularius HHB13444 TaxID=1314778 RepID=A0A5C3NKF5_9APHY|nr:hypothetical protein K466DRAFT_668567 [Polyporus arcularius HHB13444]